MSPLLILQIEKFFQFTKALVLSVNQHVFQSCVSSVEEGNSKESHVNGDKIVIVQPTLSAEFGGLGVSFASSLALGANLAFASVASVFLMAILDELFQGFLFTRAFEK